MNIGNGEVTVAQKKDFPNAVHLHVIRTVEDPQKVFWEKNVTNKIKRTVFKYF